jgi:hypothetical protein
MPKVLFKDPPEPVHVEGIHRGEEAVESFGREPGRGGENGLNYRTARDATSVNAKDRAPILPEMPEIPPV